MTDHIEEFGTYYRCPRCAHAVHGKTAEDVVLNAKSKGAILFVELNDEDLRTIPSANLIWVAAENNTEGAGCLRERVFLHRHRIIAQDTSLYLLIEINPLALHHPETKK